MPEDRTHHTSHLCSLGPRPQIMTGMFLLWLREHYADSDNIEHAVFRSRLYKDVDSSEEDESGILIEDVRVWTPTRTGMRPAILVKRNAWQHPKRFTFGGAAGTTEEGHTRYGKLWKGSHTIFCVSPVAAEAEILAAETYRFLMHFGPLCREHFKLMELELLQVGELSQVEEDVTSYVVPITIGYGWSETWIIREHVPPLRDIRLSAIFETYTGS